jgi:uncharacterized protein with von Willebrand factor type A (vWA) domain
MISIRMSPDEQARVVACASSARVTVSEWCRRLLLAAAGLDPEAAEVSRRERRAVRSRAHLDLARASAPAP